MYVKLFKPLFDFLIALVLLVLSLPLFLIISILIALTMGFPLFFRQERPGKDENIFTIYKFRTMNEKRDEKGDLLDDEQRLTRVGHFIRSLSLDELPQLFNVIKGEMSFIGPRPLLIEYLTLYSEQQKNRHKVKPGISGWAQVNGRNVITWKEKLDFDIWYTKHISFFLDVKIILMTIQKVLLRKDISADQHVTSEKFNGHN